MKLPGTKEHSGFWAATWLMGNLGRAGYYPSLEGMWPFSYDSCESGDKAFSWNDNKTQRINRCQGVQGRYCAVDAVHLQGHVSLWHRWSICAGWRALRALPGGRTDEPSQDLSTATRVV